MIKKNKILYIYTLIIILFFIISCKSHNKKDIKLAKVFNKYLYLSEVKDIFTDIKNPKDSLVILNNYINNWIRQEVIAYEANKQLSDEEKNFEKQIEDYKNSQLIYKYEQKLLEKIDTNVSPIEIEKYYISNPDNFQLKDNIVKILYIKLPKQISNTQKIKKWFDENDIAELKKYSQQYATNYYLDDKSWLLFDDILKEIPIKTYNQEDYIKNNKYISLQDNQYSYFLKIIDFKIKDNLSPLSLEKNNIKNIIINLRKMNLIKHIEDSLYNKATLDKNNIKIYKH
jgi:hypothetical protein